MFKEIKMEIICGIISILIVIIHSVYTAVDNNVKGIYSYREIPITKKIKMTEKISQMPDGLYEKDGYMSMVIKGNYGKEEVIYIIRTSKDAQKLVDWNGINKDSVRSLYKVKSGDVRDYSRIFFGINKVLVAYLD